MEDLWIKQIFEYETISIMNNLAARILDLAIRIQQIPSPTFQEGTG